MLAENEGESVGMMDETVALAKVAKRESCDSYQEVKTAAADAIEDKPPASSTTSLGANSCASGEGGESILLIKENKIVFVSK